MNYFKFNRSKHEKESAGFLLLNISLVFILPLLSILLEHVFNGSIINWRLVEKWFIFWAVGIRLFTAGVKQASDPAFTATKIFKLSSKEAYVVIRELGFANICIGITGILSLINNEWRQIAAISGALFFALAALQHISRKPKARNEIIAAISDTLIAIMMLLFIVFTF